MATSTACCSGATSACSAPYSKTLYFVDLAAPSAASASSSMRAFEESLNSKRGSGKLRVHAVFIPYARQLLPALIAGKGDDVSANLTITPERQKLVDFTVRRAGNVETSASLGPHPAKIRHRRMICRDGKSSCGSPAITRAWSRSTSAFAAQGKPPVRLQGSTRDA